MDAGFGSPAKRPGGRHCLWRQMPFGRHRAHEGHGWLASNTLCARRDGRLLPPPHTGGQWAGSAALRGLWDVRCAQGLGGRGQRAGGRACDAQFTRSAWAKRARKACLFCCALWLCSVLSPSPLAVFSASLCTSSRVSWERKGEIWPGRPSPFAVLPATKQKAPQSTANVNLTQDQDSPCAGLTTSFLSLSVVRTPSLSITRLFSSPPIRASLLPPSPRLRCPMA
ncbi:hypothetical protein B0J12DRAFT_52434 [Macrophomina phaseolina]|uniref:Uncharacterized protein n=1 Tax=Macrophomina phaseolina TaxID=35725 RepID=A0ABQ8GF34_9PEZI|nr:hypothetical protein B0J12DRAFT_52434 [Macrophomina phaseolina]